MLDYAKYSFMYALMFSKLAKRDIVELWIFMCI